MINRCHRCALVLSLVALLFAQSSAQVKSGTIITGRVRDAEAGGPVENAIVFLANTPRGTSTGPQGDFILARIPAGEYDLVVSRVGYDRYTTRLKVAKADTISLDIRLVPKLVTTGGVEVLGKRPREAQIGNEGIFLPRDTAGIYCIFGQVSSQPIGILFTDSAFYLYSLEPAVIDSEKYIRLWLLYKNVSGTPYDLDPLRSLRLYVSGKKHVYRDISPAPPPLILAHVSIDTARAMISRNVDPGLRAYATYQTGVTFEDDRFEFWSLDYKIKRHPPTHFHATFGPSREGSLSAVLYGIFVQSVDDGILRHHLVYPDNSINGYVYFPFPGMDYKTAGTDFPDAFEYQYTLVISTPTGTRAVEFTPGGL